MSKSKEIVYISHGGGPMPLLGEPNHMNMVAELKRLAGVLARPSAILLISAHWEEAGEVRLTAGQAPGLIYDYYGFPPESYEIQYPCPGEPALAAKVQEALASSGIPVSLDYERGFDHGVFVPLKIMYPDADIPCVELSLMSSLDAEAHIAIGKALQQLDYENLLVIGSGFSFHNMRAFGMPDKSAVEAYNSGFQHWLKDLCCDTAIAEPERQNRLVDWESAPNARFCHPREEHLLPLHVCYGLAQRPASDGRHIHFGELSASFVSWL